VQGATEAALTILDALEYLDEIPICVAYDVDGEIVENFPNPAQLDRARPVFEKLPGWVCDISGIRTFQELPQNARAYVLRIEDLIGVPIKWVSVGPEREEMIVR
jgi:adenylosuccinate synthase